MLDGDVTDEVEAKSLQLVLSLYLTVCDLN